MPDRPARQRIVVPFDGHVIGGGVNSDAAGRVGIGLQVPLIGEDQTADGEAADRLIRAAGVPLPMLPAIGGARAVSRRRDVVSFLVMPAASTFHFDRSGVTTDLATLIATPDARVGQTVGINTSGQIAALADSGSGPVAVLITP